MNANLRGSLFMAGAMLAFSVEDALYKQAASTVPPGLALTLFGLGGTVLYALLSLRAGEPVVTRDMLRRPLLIRSAIELAARLFFALALAFTPLSSTSAILQAAPLAVTLGAALFLGERVGPRRWTAMGIGFLGVLLILRPSPDAFRADALLAVAAMICFSARDLATRVSPPTVSPWQLGTSGFISVTAAGLVIMAARGEAPALPPSGALALLLGMTLFGVAAYTLLTLAMRTGEIAVVAPFRYVRLLAALIIAVLAFGERPDIWMLAGAVLIVGSGIYTLLRGRRTAAGH